MRRLLRRPEGKVPEAAIHRPAQDLKIRPCPDFDLAGTLNSGQVFRWIQSGTVFSGWIGESHVQVLQQDSALTFQGVSSDRIERFFSLDLDLKQITRQIDTDEIIHAAIQDHWGLRLIRQDPWECLASFILSSFNNIPRLTRMLETLAVRFGEPAQSIDNAWGQGFEGNRRPERARFSASELLFGGESEGRRLAKPTSLGSASVPENPCPRASSLCRFPRARVLVRVSERVLRNCGLGFRAPYLRAAAQMVTRETADLEQWRGLEDGALRCRLLTIPGVGEKVVECVMLFAYGRASAFPVDVWIGRAMRAWYFRRRKVTDRQIREFARKHFGPQCGWAQQYLYCQARKGSRFLSKRPFLQG